MNHYHPAYLELTARLDLALEVIDVASQLAGAEL